MKCFKMMAAIIAGGALAIGSAPAAENGVINDVPGAAGTNRAGFPPFAGLFMSEQFAYRSANGLYGDNGKKRPVSDKDQADSSITRSLASYKFALPGQGDLYSQLVPPVVGLNTLFGQHASTFGLSNITNRVLFKQRNETTKYLSGTVYALDFQAGWNVSPQLKVGAVGGFFTQISNDSAPSGVGPDGNRSEYPGVGPSVTDATKFFGRPINVNANDQIGAYARNTTKSSTA